MTLWIFRERYQKVETLKPSLVRSHSRRRLEEFSKVLCGLPTKLTKRGFVSFVGCSNGECLFGEEPFEVVSFHCCRPPILGLIR
jgi:hypothetical protein